MPKYIIIRLLENAAMNRQCDLKSIYFYQYNVKFISLYIDDQSILSKLLMPNFVLGNYIRAYD